MKTGPSIIVYVLLFLLAVYLKNKFPGYLVTIFAALPLIYLAVCFFRNTRPANEKIRKFGIAFLLSSALGFALLVTEPDFYGVYFGMVALLISKFFFLQLLRWTLGFFAIVKWQNLIRILLIGTCFLLFFHYFLVDKVDTFYLYPIFIYLFVDTITLYALFPILEEKKPHRWLGFWAIVLFVASDFVCAFYLFIHWIDDNYASTLIISYISLFLCTEYLRKIHFR